MPSRRIDNFPESRRGLGHVALTIFGSTVGYPSESLASCWLSVRLSHWLISQKRLKKLEIKTMKFSPFGSLIPLVFAG